MARDKLSDYQIRARKEPGLLGDGAGLWLKIGPTGGKSWVFRYPAGTISLSAAGRTYRKMVGMGLGRYPDVTLAMARDRAMVQRRLLLDGIDPLAKRNDDRDQRLLNAAKAMTFQQAAEHYIKAHEATWKSAKHAGQWTATLGAHVYPVIGNLPVAAINTDLVLRVIDPIWQKIPETASRIRGRIEMVLGYAKSRGWRTGENPAAWSGHLEYSLAPVGKLAKATHHAALPYGEIAKFMAELRQVDHADARALEFLILTAARTNEVVDMAWSEVNARTWTIPAARMKAGRDHVVPLSDAAMALLPAARTEGRVFRLNIQSLRRVLKTLRPNSTVHGFRSSFRDWAGDMTEYPREVAEMALAHIVGDATEQAYRRSDALEKRRCLLYDWARYCDGQTVSAENVVAIAARRG
jgi:integrase